MVDERAVRQQIADGLVIARKRARLTQAQVAERLGFSVAAVRHHERGRRSPLLLHLPAYAAAFGITCRRLINDMRLVTKRRNPGTTTGAFADGSAMGDRSTACGLRGDAGHDPAYRRR